MNELVQMILPEALKPFCFPKPFDKMRTDRIVAADKRPTKQMLRKPVVSITAQRPDLRTVVGAVDGGGDVTVA